MEKAPERLQGNIIIHYMNVPREIRFAYMNELSYQIWRDEKKHKKHLISKENNVI